MSPPPKIFAFKLRCDNFVSFKKTNDNKMALGKHNDALKASWILLLATVFWGFYAVGFAQFGRNFGALIEAVNMVGSLFYGGLLGVFVLAFGFKHVGANGAFYGVLVGEAAIFAAAIFTKISFLWYNVIGAVVVVLAALSITALTKLRTT